MGGQPGTARRWVAPGKGWDRMDGMRTGAPSARGAGAGLARATVGYALLVQVVNVVNPARWGEPVQQRQGDIMAEHMPAFQVLTVNSGSSSLKFAVFTIGSSERRVLAGQLDDIGGSRGRLRVVDAADRPLVDQPTDLPDHDGALHRLLQWLAARPEARGLNGVGHRLVHGGAGYAAPQRVTLELRAALQDLVSLAPDHLPQELAALDALARFLPEVPQVVCFDTAFHRTMPLVARQYALPRPLWDAGLQRYGFHGLSYEYIVSVLTGEGVLPSRLIIAHLGNGASMAAVRDGRSVDTTMGFTPAGGLVMGTRSGDLDPGVLLYLLRQRGFTPAALDRLVNREAGLLGVSGRSASMLELLAAAAGDTRAAEAVALFCYQARKSLGALATVLGGLDTLVFTGGIGAHAAVVRARVCADLAFLGIELAPDRNTANASLISAQTSAVRVRVIATDEERVIARHTAAVLRGASARATTDEETNP
jgi:acetate kinase